MKDKKRIKRILKKLEKVWLNFSDLRLGQGLMNVAESRKIDLFYLEDEELERLLDILIEEINNPYYRS